MQRSYLSLSLSRAWGMDNPVGDPFGGPAYGERAMPVVAVIAAGMGMAAGVGMVAAAGGFAAMSIGSALVAGSLIAGGALTIVGTVTGNQKLTKIGGTLSLIGGIGAMAQGAIAGWQGAAGKEINTVTGSLAEAAKGAVTYPGEMMAKGMGTISDSFGNFFGGSGAGAEGSAYNLTADTTKTTFAAPSSGADAWASTGQGALFPDMQPSNVVPDADAASASSASSAASAGTNVRGTTFTAPTTTAPTTTAAPTGGLLGGMTTGEKMMTASMAMQGAGAIMTSQAQKAAAEQANENDQERQTRINAIVRVATTREEFDRYNTQGVAAVYLPPTTPTLAARPPIQAPTTTPQNWNMANMQQQQPVVAAVRGAVAPQGFVQAPTFQV